MRYARGSSSLLLALFLGIFFSGLAWAQETPSLTWERGKTLNVVLGGSVDNLNWDIYLEGYKEKPRAFSRSSKNSSGFYVYTIALPREFALGSYQVIARDADGSTTTVAAVQVVERFQYNILEIPKDLIFLLLLFVFFISIQLTVRIWDLRKSELELSSNDPSVGLKEALLSQRRRWQERWLGQDYVPADFGGLNSTLAAYLPFLGSVLAIYAAVSGNLLPLSSLGSGLILALLCSLTILDRYTAKLCAVTFSTIFIFFSATLNLPSIIAYLLLMTMFFLPQYIGDLVRVFFIRSFDSMRSAPQLAEGLAALAAGASVFWVYLLSESLIFSQDTDASRVTPAAIAVAFAFLVRAQLSKSASSKLSAGNRSDREVASVVSLPSIFGVNMLAMAIFYIWTGNLAISVISALFLCGGLFSIHLAVSRTRSSRITQLLKPVYLILIVLLFEIAQFSFLNRFPLVAGDRSELLLVISGIPLMILSIYKLFTTIPDFSGRGALRNVNEIIEVSGEEQ